MDAVFVKGFGSTAPLSALLRRKKNVFLFLSSEVAVPRVQTEPIASCSEIFAVTKIGHKPLRCSFRKRIIVQAIHSTHFLHGGEDVTANEAETYQNAIQSTTPVTQTGSQFRIGPYDGLTFLLSLMACTVSLIATLLFIIAIPTLHAIRKTAKAMERLADSLREELPATMAAVRLSGMEISDLTMELSDLSQEISQGVRSSTRAVQAAEDGLRRIRTLATTQTKAALHERASSAVVPAIASVARSARDTIVGAKTAVQSAGVLRQVAGWAGSVLPKRKSEGSSESKAPHGSEGVLVQGSMSEGRN